MLSKQEKLYQNDHTAAQSFLAIGQSASEDDVADPTKHAALAAIVLALFNLDESLTRE